MLRTGSTCLGGSLPGREVVSDGREFQPRRGPGTHLRHSRRDTRPRLSMGLFPASPQPVTGGAADERPAEVSREPHNAGSDKQPDRARVALCALAAVVLVGALVPPLSTVARRVEVLEALQFALL